MNEGWRAGGRKGGREEGREGGSERGRDLLTELHSWKRREVRGGR